MSNKSATLECAVCLREEARKPVVTRCGHVFCWRCLFRWAWAPISSFPHFQRHSSCPLCKSPLPDPDLHVTPIYAATSSTDEDDDEDGGVCDVDEKNDAYFPVQMPDSSVSYYRIPPRPSPRPLTANPNPNPQQHQQALPTNPQLLQTISVSYSYRGIPIDLSSLTLTQRLLPRHTSDGYGDQPYNYYARFSENPSLGQPAAVSGTHTYNISHPHDDIGYFEFSDGNNQTFGMFDAQRSVDHEDRNGYTHLSQALEDRTGYTHLYFEVSDDNNQTFGEIGMFDAQPSVDHEGRTGYTHLSQAVGEQAMAERGYTGWEIPDSFVLHDPQAHHLSQALGEQTMAERGYTGWEIPDSFVVLDPQARHHQRVHDQLSIQHQQVDYPPHLQVNPNTIQLPYQPLHISSHVPEEQIVSESGYIWWEIPADPVILGPRNHGVGHPPGHPNCIQPLSQQHTSSSGYSSLSHALEEQQQAMSDHDFVLFRRSQS